MTFLLPELPYASDALAPFMLARTLEIHHGKHHQAYVDALNKNIVGTPHAQKTLEEIIRDTANDESSASIFNNAAQVWNHTFFWNSMKPMGGGFPSMQLMTLLTTTFGGFENFKAKFKEAALAQFGSGWVWLAMDAGKPVIVTTSNAMNPLATGKVALLACDVWEHAYYLDYQNRRGDMVHAFLNHLVNWEFAEGNLAHALHKDN